MMIVSGAYMIGTVLMDRSKKRYKILKNLQRYFDGFFTEMSAYRASFDENAFHNIVSEGDLLMLSKCDREILQRSICALKNGTYEQAVDSVKETMIYLKEVIHSLESNLRSNRKSVPLISACIGLLVAIMLF